jgi:alpha-maltose-1-phosphate synthase
MPPSANCAIDYFPATYTSQGPQLMGINAANEGFLKGFVRHARVDELVAYTRSADEFQAFQDHVSAVRGAAFPTRRAHANSAATLAQTGALLHPFPGFGPLAWNRRFTGSQAYSLLGITHTIATHAVMDSIGQLAIAPIEPWDAVVCTSLAVRQTYDTVLLQWEAHLRDRLGASKLPRPLLPIIPLGVDTAMFQSGEAAQETRTELRQALNIASDAIAVLWVGRFNHVTKAHPMPAYLALQALSEQVSQPIVYVQAGWFPSPAIEQQFKSAAQRFAPGVQHVFVDGRAPQWRQRIWSVADIFMSLSDNVQESFGLTPIEAMAAKLPVVVSDWDGYRDTVRQGVDGFLIPTTMPTAGMGQDLAQAYANGSLPYDAYCGITSQTVGVHVPACVKALVALAENADLRQRMGESGQTRARDHYDWRHIVTQYQALLLELRQIREHTADTSARTHSTQAHPLRGDPYGVFAAFPSQALGPGFELQAAPDASAEMLKALHDEDLHRFSKPWRASLSDMQNILSMVTEQPGIRIEQLGLQMDEPHRILLHRTLAWMLKIGVLTSAAHAPS